MSQGMQPYSRWQDREGASSFPAHKCGWCFSSTSTAQVLCHKHSYGAVYMYTHPENCVPWLTGAFTISGPCFHTKCWCSGPSPSILICTLHLSLAAMAQDLMPVSKRPRKDRKPY